MLHEYKNILNSIGCLKKPNTSILLKDKLIYTSSNLLIFICLINKTCKIKIYESSSIKLLTSKGDNIIVVDEEGKIFLNHEFIINLNKEIICLNLIDDCLVVSDFLSLTFIDTKRKQILENKNISNVTSIALIKYNEQILSVFGKIDGSIQLIFNSVTQIFQAHFDKINSLELKIDNSGFNLLSSSSDTTVKVHTLDISALFSDNSLINVTYISDLNIQLSLVLNHTLPVFVAKFEGENILTASADNSIIYFKEGKEMRFGGLHAKNRAFYNSFVIDDKVIGHSNTGGFYEYNLVTGRLGMLVGGHQGGIRSLDWFNDELLTASRDGTARIWSKHIRNELEISSSEEIYLKQERWVEVNRPIIHGYYLNGVKFIKGIDTSSFKICCYSEEPIIRIYEPTKLTYRLSNKIIVDEDMPDYATLAELSLTNERHFEDEDCANKRVDLNEKTLAEMTLFNEERKIYAHYFEVSALCAYSNIEQTQYLFSANISSHKKYAGIFVHNLKYEKLQYITCHDSTINELRVSNCNKYLLAVSRDKTSSIYTINLNSDSVLKLLNHNINSHTREVYNCAFSFDSKMYATCGRDKTINLYSLKEDKNELIFVIRCERTPRALEFTQEESLLVGYEDGVLEEMSFNGSVIYAKKLHGERINCLRFDKDFKYLITGGEDGLLRIFRQK